MEVLETLLLAHLRHQVSASLDQLQFAFHPKVGVEDTMVWKQPPPFKCDQDEGDNCGF